MSARQLQARAALVSPVGNLEPSMQLCVSASKKKQLLQAVAAAAMLQVSCSHPKGTVCTGLTAKLLTCHTCSCTCRSAGAAVRQASAVQCSQLGQQRGCGRQQRPCVLCCGCFTRQEAAHIVLQNHWAHRVSKPCRHSLSATGKLAT
jgi:hypothetical protein